MTRIVQVVALGAFGLALAGCNGSSVSPVTQHGYTQIELLSRPAVKEVFEKFVDHQVTNASEPYNDPTLQGEIQSFTDALRPPNVGAGSDYGHALAGILYPNEMTADLSQAGAAAYLGVETGGATSLTHSTFGGRAISDDVVSISLGAIFGHTLANLSVQPEDNEENNCLTTDNVAQNATQQPSNTFPYLSAPH